MWPSWMYMLIEYTDKVAGIGYPKRIRAEFTGEETLLTRAEARIFMGKIDEAVSDLNIWAQSHDTDASHPLTQLTSKVIKNWYKQWSGSTPVHPSGSQYRASVRTGTGQHVVYA